MARTHYLVGGAAALGAAAVISACTNSKEIVMQKAADPLFQSYVALGNSLTAGFQSAGINDSTQRDSYAHLFAIQAGTRFAQPLLNRPGCPPPLTNLLTGVRVGGDTSSTTCVLRTTGSITSVLNDVAVPGATSIDPTSASSASSNALTTFILGGLTQDQRAAQANPTFISIWIGNNDVLSAAYVGVLVPTAGVSPGLTPLATFQANYLKMIKGLSSIGTVQGGILIAVGSEVPLFFPGYLLNDPSVFGAFQAVVGRPVVLDTSCSVTTTALVNFALAGQIRALQMPDTVACRPGLYPDPRIGQIYVLDSAEVVALNATIDAYNAFIKSEAATLGWAYMDARTVLAPLYGAPGGIPLFPDLTTPTDPFGPYISLDGIHPHLAAHKLIADLMIDSVNAHYGTSLTPVP